jgi:hypothetical protein
MIFDDGTPFFGIGENMADVSHYWHSSPNGNPNLGWLTYYKRDFWDVTNSMNEMSEAGGNYMRMAMFRWLYAIESEHLGVYDRYDDNAPCCNDGTSSNGHQYGNRQYNLWALDQIFNLAREKGIYIQLATDYTYPHSAYQTHFWGNNCYVTNYVYRPNDTPPYDHPEYYLIGTHPDPQVQGSLYYWKRKFKYFSSRWGYAVNIAAYETMGEVDKYLGYTNQNLTNAPGICDNKVTYSESSAVRTTIYDWHTEIGDYLKNILTDKHMLTVSYTPYGTYHYSGNAAAERDYHNLFYHPRIDLIDIHHYDDGQEMFGGSRYDNPGHIGRYWMTNEFVNCNTCPASNGQTYDGLGVDKPFHMGECSTWGKDINVNPNGTAVNTSVSKLYDNYEVSFHNELWATAMMGNFTTGLSWAWHVIHWWPDALHGPRPEFPFNPTPSNQLGDVNEIQPDILGIVTPVFIENKKIFHDYKPLSEFMSSINQYYSLFPTSKLIPRKYINPSNGIEVYYLLADDGETGFGWVHNYYKYWGNAYYGYQGTTTENYGGCLEETSPSQSFVLEGLNSFAEYSVSFHTTRMLDNSEASQVLPNNYTAFSIGNTLSVPITGAILGCDTSNISTGTSADFAFSFSGMPFRKARPDSQENPVVKNANIEVTINPSPGSGIININVSDFQNYMRCSLDIFDCIGKNLLKNVRLDNDNYWLDLSIFPKGIYYLRVVADSNFKMKKLIIQ